MKKQTLQQNVNNVMQKILDLEQSRRSLQSELETLHVVYNALKKAAS